jgi:internalin A
MKKLFFLAIGLTLLAQATLVSTASARSKSFAQWCQQKSSVPAATRHTIDVLLKQAGTKNCQQADSKLRSLTDLNLNRSQISDVKPLAGLTNLIQLFLYGNQISDVKPLAGLTNLTYLLLESNQITDIKPLAGLTNLNVLHLESNQITDINPLAGLSNLKHLYLQSNPISAKVCPVEASVCAF